MNPSKKTLPRMMTDKTVVKAIAVRMAAVLAHQTQVLLSLCRRFIKDALSTTPDIRRRRGRLRRSGDADDRARLVLRNRKVKGMIDMKDDQCETNDA